MFHKIGQYPNPERDTLYHDMIQDILNEINVLIETLKCIMQHHNETLKITQPNIVLSNLKQPARTK